MKQTFGIITVILVLLFLVWKSGILGSGLMLDGIVPDQAAAGDVVTLNGHGFVVDPGQTTVFFNDQSVRPEEVSETAIQVKVPQGARSGLVSVVSGSKTSDQVFFKIKDAGLPPGHPPTGNEGGMPPGQAAARQQMPPGTGEHGGETVSSSAHQFFSPETAKDYIDFELKDKAGKTVKLSDYKGKVVLLNFWATWCKPCLEEIPSLERLTKRSESMGLVVLAVSVDKTFEEIITALPNVNLNILLDPEKAVATKYGTVKFPETWVIDKNGKIISRFIGSRNWDSPTFVNFFSLLLKDGTLPGGMGQSAGASPHGKAGASPHGEHPPKAGASPHGEHPPKAGASPHGQHPPKAGASPHGEHPPATGETKGEK